jgi:hypothetical protein
MSSSADGAWGHAPLPGNRTGSQIRPSFPGRFHNPAQLTEELGTTSGYGRCQRDYYVPHHKPTRLFVKALWKNATRSLQAEHLKPALIANTGG